MAILKFPLIRPINSCQIITWVAVEWVAARWRFPFSHATTAEATMSPDSFHSLIRLCCLYYFRLQTLLEIHALHFHGLYLMSRCFLIARLVVNTTLGFLYLPTTYILLLSLHFQDTMMKIFSFDIMSFSHDTPLTKATNTTAFLYCTHRKMKDDKASLPTLIAELNASRLRQI